MKKRGKSFKKEEFKTKICGCQYFVVVLLYGWGSWTRTNDAGVKVPCLNQLGYTPITPGVKMAPRAGFEPATA